MPPKYITDADRLKFLLKFFSIDDIGDEQYTPGVCIRHEELEDVLTWGAYPGHTRRNLCERGPFDLDAMRRHIDVAIFNSGGA